jgi:hypothetical protein
MLRAFREPGRRREMRRSGRSGMGRQRRETRCHEETKGWISRVRRKHRSRLALSLSSVSDVRRDRDDTTHFFSSYGCRPEEDTPPRAAGARQTSRLDRRRRRGVSSSASEPGGACACSPVRTRQALSAAMELYARPAVEDSSMKLHRGRGFADGVEVHAGRTRRTSRLVTDPRAKARASPRDAAPGDVLGEPEDDGRPPRGARLGSRARRRHNTQETPRD